LQGDLGNFDLGAFLSIAGAFRRKAHSEKPENEPLAPGVARLVLGRTLVAAPAWMEKTKGASENDADQTKQTKYQTVYLPLEIEF
jgi:hypothetical protein